MRGAKRAVGRTEEVRYASRHRRGANSEYERRMQKREKEKELRLCAAGRVVGRGPNARTRRRPTRRRCGIDVSAR